MSAFYFGPAGRQLYGYFHDGGYTATGATLICPPWGGEYQNSHRTMRVLARQLAERGHHVLRFDYSGAGDSWGETTDADLERWQADVALAARELRTLSGSDRITLVGLRLGAYIAASAAATLPGVDGVVLYDPIVNGTLWVREMTEQHPHSVSPDGVVEFGRLPVSKRFHEQVSNLASLDLDVLSRQRTLVITSRDSEMTTAINETFGNAGISVEHIPDITPWIGDLAIDHGQLPTRVLRRVLDWYDGG